MAIWLRTLNAAVSPLSRKRLSAAFNASIVVETSPIKCKRRLATLSKYSASATSQSPRVFPSWRWICWIDSFKRAELLAKRSLCKSLCSLSLR
ncbi:hypothetical protein BMETH_978_0 [methanotrophic bacterial endosymbiont of Bathymodiolus sp.]|nr:hypothetical protein BMETH_978_0 [methanotrophic bacterial endosymbiont of Bathymodiolus sp.]